MAVDGVCKGKGVKKGNNNSEQRSVCSRRFPFIASGSGCVVTAGTVCAIHGIILTQTTPELGERGREGEGESEGAVEKKDLLCPLSSIFLSVSLSQGCSACGFAALVQVKRRSGFRSERREGAAGLPLKKKKERKEDVLRPTPFHLPLSWGSSAALVAIVASVHG